jgi:2-oxoglutarate ferredoxin oxidoreductase subunit alpha
MLDECVGHMTEKVVIPPAEEIEITPRRITAKKPEDYLPYEPDKDLVPEMAIAGRGYRFHSTGLTHDERGYPEMSVECQDRLVRRLVSKVKENAKDIAIVEKENIAGAEVILLSYGISARVSHLAVTKARKKGIKVGRIRLITVWPFPQEDISAIAGKVKAFIVPEINMGQISREVERAVHGKSRVVSVPHAGGGVHDPEIILNAIIKAAK